MPPTTRRPSRRPRNEVEQEEREGAPVQTPGETPTPTPEPEPDEQEEPAAPPAPPAPPDSEAIGRELERHLGAMGRLLGAEAAGYNVCAKCMGWGISDEPEPPFDPDTAPCPRCESHGRTRTGSSDPQHAYRLCVRCGGRGYLERPPEATTPVAAYAAQEAETNGFGTPAWMGDPNLNPHGVVPPAPFPGPTV